MCIPIHVYSLFASTSCVIELRPSPMWPIPVFVDIGLVSEMLGSLFGWKSLVFACLPSLGQLHIRSRYVWTVQAVGLVDSFVELVGCPNRLVLLSGIDILLKAGSLIC